MSQFEMKLRRLRTFVLGWSSQRDLDEELRYHIEMLAADNMNAGMSAERARAEAFLRFGDVERIKNQCRAIHRGGLSDAVRWLMGIVLVCGALLWASSQPGEMSVLGQMLIITVALFRLLMYLKASPSLYGKSALRPAELSVFKAAPMTSGFAIKEAERRNTSLFKEVSRNQMPKFVALGAVIAFCLCAVVIASSAKSLSTHLRQSQEKKDGAAEKFVGTWVLTVGDIYDLGDSSLPQPFRNLPRGLSRNLPVAEVSIEIRDGKITGRRRLYGYTTGTGSGSPVAERNEVNLVNIRAEANILSGTTATAEGEPVPGDWQMKLTGEKEVEVRVVRDVPEEQKKLVLKLHRPQN